MTFKCVLCGRDIDTQLEWYYVDSKAKGPDEYGCKDCVRKILEAPVTSLSADLPQDAMRWRPRGQDRQLNAGRVSIPHNMVLTLDDVQTLAKNYPFYALWGEYKSADVEDGETCAGAFGGDFSGYGELFRLWRYPRRPTDFELSFNPWGKLPTVTAFDGTALERLL